MLSHLVHVKEKQARREGSFVVCPEVEEDFETFKFGIDPGTLFRPYRCRDRDYFTVCTLSTMCAPVLDGGSYNVIDQRSKTLRQDPK